MLNTARKISIARTFATLLLRLGVRPQRRIRRRGIAYDIDLREGIDLSLFLFGAFQKHVVDTVRALVPRDATVIDVGANVGAVTLPLAAYLQGGRVYAIEPTTAAHEKLVRNVSLNRELAARIRVQCTFIADRTAPVSELVAYGSWPIVGEEPVGAHPVHHGVALETHCGQTTLDDFVAEEGIAKVDLIKIDTDGHEFAVLSGAARVMERMRPAIIFEACEYLMRPPQPTFDDFAALFAAREYVVCGEDRRPIDAAAFARKCPLGGSLDLVAIPK